MSQITASVFAAWVEQLLGAKASVEEHSRACLALSEEHRLPHWKGFAQALLAWSQGDAQGVEAGWEARTRVGAAISTPYLQGLQADCLEADPQAARTLLTVAIQAAEQSLQKSYLPGLLLKLGRVCAQLGKQEQALGHCRSALELSSRLGAGLFVELAETQLKG